MITIGSKDLEFAAPEISLERCELTDEQKPAWKKSVAAFQWNVPYFSSLLYSMMAEGEDLAHFTKGIDTLGTDDKRLFINPDCFFAMPLEEQMAAIAHEVGHAMLGHCGMKHHFRKLGYIPMKDGTRLPFDAELVGVAQDLIVNDMVVESKTGRIGKDWVWEPKIANAYDSFIAAYGKLYKKQQEQQQQQQKQGDQQQQGGGGGQGQPGKDKQQGQGKGQPGQGQPQPGQGGGQPQKDERGTLGSKKQHDHHLQPGSGSGQKPEQAMADRDEGAWKSAVAKANAAAKARGMGSAALDRLTKSLLEPQTDWRDELATEMSRTVGNGGRSWQSLDNEFMLRQIGVPGQTSYDAGIVIVAYDSSGSVKQSEIDVFMGDTAGIIEDANPKQLYLLSCDYKITGVTECEDVEDLKRAKVKGGGGTKFKPVFDWVEQEGITPDVLIYYTDMECSFPEQPNYPVIWCATTDKKAPFGKTIRVKSN